jgi:hypothetical protein
VDVPGQNFRLASGAPVINAGTFLNPAVLPANAAVQQYVKHEAGETRPSDFALDIGAYEFSAATASLCDLNSDASVNVVDVQFLVNIALGIVSGQPGQGDLNHDGLVNVIDLQLLINTILGTSACPA